MIQIALVGVGGAAGAIALVATALLVAAWLRRRRIA
jgi:hypothetical protein